MCDILKYSYVNNTLTKTVYCPRLIFYLSQYEAHEKYFLCPKEYFYIFFTIKPIKKQVYNKDLYQVQETLKKLGEFSTIWANLVDWADFGRQKLFSKLSTIFSRKTHDSFQINIQKMTQIRKRWSPLFSNQKRNVGFNQ